MLLFVGLGNPGKKFENTRHNAGFMWLDAFANFLKHSKYYIVTDEKIENKEGYAIREVRTPISHGGNIVAFLVKPLNFMNLSGPVVSSIVSKYKIPVQNIYIAHDDLDIPLGKFKVTKGIFPKTHKGILSIHASLKKLSMWYIRIGVDNRQSKPEYKPLAPADYVLLKMTEDELFDLKTGIINSISTTLKIVKDL